MRPSVRTALWLLAVVTTFLITRPLHAGEQEAPGADRFLDEARKYILLGDEEQGRSFDYLIAEGRVTALELSGSYQTGPQRPWGVVTIAPTRTETFGFDLEDSAEVTVVLPQIWHFNEDGEPQCWNMGRGWPRHNDLRVDDQVILVALRANHDPWTGPWVLAFDPHLSVVFCAHIVTEGAAEHVTVVESTEPDWSDHASQVGEPLTLMSRTIIARTFRGYELSREQAFKTLCEWLSGERM